MLDVTEEKEEIKDVAVIGAVAVQKPTMLMVDSGAPRTVWEQKAFPRTVLTPDHERLLLTSITGGSTTRYGRKEPRVMMSSGRQGIITGKVTSSLKNALSVSQSNDKGMTMVFGPSGAYMSRLEPPRPQDAEPFERQGGHYYLPVWEVEGENDVPAAVIAPVEVVEPDSEGQIKVCNQCGTENLVRYKFCMECAAKFEEEKMDDIDDDTLLAGAGPKPAASNLLKVPMMPDMEEVRKHNLTHAVYAPWCQHCVAGRSRGKLHLSIDQTVQPLEHIEFDYTYWSETGFKVVDGIESAACSITGIDRKTSMPATTIVQKKGIWAYAVALVVNYVLKLGRQSYVLRGDGEFALQAFLRAVAEQLGLHGKVVKIELTQNDSHQSIGGAEKCHDVIAGFVGTLANVVKHHTGVDIRPSNRLFAWLLRHACFIVARYPIRREGLTALHALTGAEPTDRLAQFREVVQFRVSEPKRQSKALPRWFKGVWVGINELDNASIVLTEGGYETARNVSRMAEENQWSAEWLQKVKGLPWSRHEGNEATRQKALKSRAEVSSLPFQALPMPPAAVEAMQVDPAQKPVDIPVPSSSGTPSPSSSLAASQAGEAAAVVQPEGQQMDLSLDEVVSPTGDGRAVQAGRLAAWQAEGESSPKKWKPAADADIGWILAIIDSAESLVPSNEVGAIEDMKSFLTPAEIRLELRQEEISKLESFGCFRPVPLSSVSRSEIYKHLWVETSEKSRLTLQDLRRCGQLEEIVHCPTPSNITNNIMEAMSVYKNMPMVCFDVVSAFPHAAESSENIFMWPPLEWDSSAYAVAMVWHMHQSLYGRRPACANFRDWFEEVLIGMSRAEMKRGDSQPCGYRSEPLDAALTHHIDDGRVVASSESIKLILVHLAEYMLLKVSDEIVPGKAVKHLGRIKLRIPNGWVTIPDEKHLANVFRCVGYDERAPGREVLTPGVKRTGSPEDEQELEADRAAGYRSATGSLIYYMQDREEIAFSVKELARSIHNPREGEWHDLTRLARFLFNSHDYMHANVMDEEVKSMAVPVVKVFHDSDWAGSKADRKSTTGLRASIGGFKLMHSSSTQPGLPALSSGEDELRGMTKASSEGLYIKHVCKELGMPVEIELLGDASAALANAKKLGPGRIRHLETYQMFIKEALRKKLLRSKQLSGKNIADLHTTYYTNEVLKEFWNDLGLMSAAECPMMKQMVMCELTRVNTFSDIRSFSPKDEA